ncbi:MAG: DegT/DnrJ/EryC1/StrS family aminotransferase [Candidatus Diapherotrites archaeon]|uniref:DegT/DnrJ/EryC1/StrS family aminotransferase n=1 Tax=Candidatus Iainarchaeum sp. TaxID=3101447 RepID=A0A8T4KXC9_9ARCH|nr:DegT/DnrJ/EryC1/StrS family aminotransferase [Candidatus Diapherotrites archaeon]
MTEPEIGELHSLIERIAKKKLPAEKFVPGKTTVNYAAPLFGAEEINAVVDSLFTGWLAEGKRSEERREKEFAKYVGCRDSIVTNSGSSALLLAFAALKSPRIENNLKEGDEVITSALTFPTSLNSVILNSLNPVLVDVERHSYNMNPKTVEEMITRKTRALLVLHHLGNPCRMDELTRIAKEHNLFLVEDCCDAHGASFNGKRVGSFGDAGCFSFYAAHAFTMGEGGSITLNNEKLYPLIYSLKTCGLDENAFKDPSKRTLYTSIGYKMRIIELQAAMGLQQLKKLPGFVEKRRQNFSKIVKGLKKFSDFLEFPTEEKGAKAAWFSVPITIKENAPFSRTELIDFLRNARIETRLLLGGNVLKQPAYAGFKIRSSSLPVTDFFHSQSFYVGCHPGMTDEMIDYVVEKFEGFMSGHGK